jgi:hypothetical protein
MTISLMPSMKKHFKNLYWILKTFINKRGEAVKEISPRDQESYQSI